MPELIIGIDPGITGALAVVEVHPYRVLSIHDIPVMPRVSGKGSQVSSALLTQKIMEIEIASRRDLHTDCVAVIEQVRAMPPVRGEQRTAGTQSSFNFGEGFGRLDGVITALGISIEYVTPQSWKKYFSLTGKEKDAARTLVLQRYPQFGLTFARKKDGGRADALLIAEFGVHKFGGQHE